MIARSLFFLLLAIIIANGNLPTAYAAEPATTHLSTWPTLTSHATKATGATQAIQTIQVTQATPQTQSGYEFQSSDTRSLQDDDFKNPGMLWVDIGKQRFAETAGAKNQSCADCHAKLPTSVAATFPKINQHLGKMVNLTSQIQHCRSVHQDAESIAYESETSLALTAYLGNQSRGKRVNQIDDAQEKTAEASIENGKLYFYQRKGQLNLSCSNCHQDSVGKMLRGDLISQGQSNGYPIYRLEWQSLGSLHRRFRSCDIGVRALPYKLGSDTYTDLEAYLKQRAGTLIIETPAVRR